MMDEFKKYLNSISDISENTWEALRIQFIELELEKGEYFVFEGDIAGDFAFLREGVIRAFYTNQEGIEYTKHFFRPPSIVGSYSSLITNEPSIYSQQALTHCKLLKANYKSILGLYDEFTDLERLARKFAEKYFVENEKKEIEIVLLNADKRYLNFQREYAGLDQLIPQYYIASFLGITPIQLSRIRRKFRQM